MDDLNTALRSLEKQLEGELFYDEMMRSIYATDASVYQEWPLAVVYPKSSRDVQHVIQFANTHGTSVIPRAAGTSLAGQVVGSGIVLDISKYMNKVLEINEEEQWVWLEPGVIRDELNLRLKKYGLFFGPITATANRAMMGGMVGNNSCGQTSIVYGSTRDHTLELECILSDGSQINFGDLSKEAFQEKLELESLEGEIYRHINTQLSSLDTQAQIKENFPKEEINRRNTGYAVDYLLKSNIFTEDGPPFNFCNVLAGSEGTLAFISKIKLHVDVLPAEFDVVAAIHFRTIYESMKAAQVAMQFNPTACELMDKVILDCTKENIEQSKNRFFVEGDPAALLLVEFRSNEEAAAIHLGEAFVKHCISHEIGYAHPIIEGKQTKQVWALRKAGLGLLSNIPGDKKAVACIEDTAVALDDLPEYIEEFTQMMESYGQEAVYYAHVGHGELHLRPILDLKTKEDRELFHQISRSSAELVKKYNGSLSGEHGDGRARAEFIPLLFGEDITKLFVGVKNCWDPHNIFNPGKIVNAPKMNTSLRYAEDQPNPVFNTILNYEHVGGILRAAEKCNGSGDCRKLPLSGGTMCPSYQATKDEKDTTRARANTLRNYLTKNTQPNPFNHQEIKEVLDLCLSCKGCTSECPSNIDMAGMKAEFLYQYYRTNGVPWISKVFANIDHINRIVQPFSSIYNRMVSSSGFNRPVKKLLKIAPQRSIPSLSHITLRKYYEKYGNNPELPSNAPRIYLFCDEFTNRMESHIGIATIGLLNALGIKVLMIAHPESGRAAISKGLLKQVQNYAEESIQIFAPLINDEVPLVGIEPSAILGFRDEYPRLVRKDLVEKASELGRNTFIIDEYIYKLYEQGIISQDQFTENKLKILLHGHCHQKSLSEASYTAWILGIPKNYEVETIPSGCCGMAGSFGYDKDKYALSMQVGELILFPAIRNNPSAVIAAPGTSCRHQIADGTQRKAQHPAEILYEALRKNDI